MFFLITSRRKYITREAEMCPCESPYFCCVMFVGRSCNPNSLIPQERPSFIYFLCIQRLLNISNDIVRIFDTYRQADQVGTYACFE